MMGQRREIVFKLLSLGMCLSNYCRHEPTNAEKRDYLCVVAFQLTCPL